MENQDPKGQTAVDSMLGVDQDGIPGFDILTPSNLLSGADGKGIRCRAQGSSLSGVTIHMKVHYVAPRLIFGLRTSPGTLRFNWHASGPPSERVIFKTGLGENLSPGPLFGEQFGSFYLKTLARRKNLYLLG